MLRAFGFDLNNGRPNGSTIMETPSDLLRDDAIYRKTPLGTVLLSLLLLLLGTHRYVTRVRA